MKRSLPFPASLLQSNPIPFRTGLVILAIAAALPAAAGPHSHTSNEKSWAPSRETIAGRIQEHPALKLLWEKGSSFRGLENSLLPLLVGRNFPRKDAPQALAEVTTEEIADYLLTLEGMIAELKSHPECYREIDLENIRAYRKVVSFIIAQIECHLPTRSIQGTTEEEQVQDLFSVMREKTVIIALLKQLKQEIHDSEKNLRRAVEFAKIRMDRRSALP